MKICLASMRHGGYGHASEFKRDVAGGYRAFAKGRVTPASLKAAAAQRAFGA